MFVGRIRTKLTKPRINNYELEITNYELGVDFKKNSINTLVKMELYSNY